MIKGIYTSASGMLPNIKKQELIAQNVANASTPGYKKDSLFTKELSRAEIRTRVKNEDWEQALDTRGYTDYSPGVFDHTGNALDLAIDGDGFFQILLDDGSKALTRNGGFTVNKDGLIALPDGPLLIADGGPIQVGNGKVTISASGDVDVDGTIVSRIAPVTVANLDKLQKIGRSLWVVPQGTELISVDKATIQQGYLEASNVDVVDEMVNMIVSYRTYEANAKGIQSQDDSLANLFRHVGGKG